jgi:hypothetical protein
MEFRMSHADEARVNRAVTNSPSVGAEGGNLGSPRRSDAETPAAMLPAPSPNPAAPEPRNAFERFTMSGLFFMIFGSVLLLIAHLSMGNTHSSLSFILVVSGVAILLYGTGTQGIGQFANSTYKVAIAGGAGVLSLVIGYGIVVKEDSIQKAFQTQTRYIKLVIKPTTQDGITGSFLANYFAVVSIDGGYTCSTVSAKNENRITFRFWVS